MIKFKYIVLLWSLFFLICFGLGYPTLNRYKPNQIEGLSDPSYYYQMVIGEPHVGGRGDIFSCRIAVPYIAKPFYWLAQGHVRTWEPVFLGLLISNSLFCTATTIFLVLIVCRITCDIRIALLAATLYLLSFSISNTQLAGMVDSSEAFFIIAVTWTLFSDKWSWLPLWSVGGTLSKETFVPFSLIFTLVWWIVAERRNPLRCAKARWLAIMAIVSLITLVGSHSLLLGRMVWPWDIAAEMNGRTNLLIAFWNCISDRSFWYIFGWLLPLGIWRLKFLPRQWVQASFFTTLVALTFAIYNDMTGSGRPLFDIVGPMLSFSVALLISEGTMPPSHEVLDT
jgi:hypothetical protein